MKTQNLFLLCTNNIWKMRDRIRTKGFIRGVAIFMLAFSFIYSLFIWISYFDYSFLGLIFCLIPFILMLDYTRNIFRKTSIEAIKIPIEDIFKSKRIYYCFVFFVYYSLKIYYRI